MNLLNQLKSFFVPKIVFKTVSKINGEIRVIQFLGKRSIQVGSLQQSGDLVESLWKKGLREITKSSPPAGEAGNSEIEKILILGLGGGSSVNIINKYFPRAEITAIEIDPQMVEIGKKFFSVKNFTNLKIIIEDAFSFLEKNKIRFNLILADLYIGRQIPQKLKTEKFIKNIKKSLQKEGLVIFNHLRNRKQIEELTIFRQLLEKEFKRVKIINPLINSLFLCQV